MPLGGESAARGTGSTSRARSALALAIRSFTSGSEGRIAAVALLARATRDATRTPEELSSLVRSGATCVLGVSCCVYARGEALGATATPLLSTSSSSSSMLTPYRAWP